MKKITIWIWLLPVCCFTHVKAQTKCFVQTSLDTRNVYAQQPFKITFTVVTATWFTQPLDFDNIQIPNAFVIPFDRTFSGRFTVNGTEYPGLQFYFIVFPYKPGNYTIPPIKIVATTVPVGEAIAKKVTISTRPEQFVVKAIPAVFQGDWFVAKDVAITQRWNKPLQHLKVGDIIERTVIEHAQGTLPQFIPEVKPGSVNWASVYPQEAGLQDTRNDYDANGVRTQTYAYLLEKEGDYELPAATVQWWNPYSQRVFKRSTGVVKIRVAANPDLGILTSIKDSLTAKQQVVVQQKTPTGPYLIYGIPWYWFTLYTLAALLLLYSIIQTGIQLYRKAHHRYIKYTDSEVYWFRQFEHSSLKFPESLKKLYAWWDRFQVPEKSSSIINETKANYKNEIADPMAIFYEEVYEKKNTSAGVSETFKKHIKEYRKKILHSAVSTDDRINIHQQPWW